MSKNSILIALPCMSWSIHTHTAGALYMLGRTLGSIGIESSLFMLNGHSFIPAARNIIADKFLSSEATHLLCIDSDIGFEPDDVLRLAELDVEFASAMYRLKTDSEIKYSAAMTKEGQLFGVGFGFCLLSRSVFERMKNICDTVTTQTDEGVKEITDFFGPLREGKNLLSEDMSFCKRWKSVGGEISLNTDISLVHYGNYGFRKGDNV